MKIARTRTELNAALAALRAARPGIGFAPTMGALHQGHLSLLAAARRDGLALAASIFVNPLQFAPTEDLARYPRDEAGDLRLLREIGCDLVWLPDVATMYPPDSATTIDVEGPARGYEGAARPGHFRGVATVVARLFGQIRPDRAYFGEKDWQQLQVVTRMAADLGLPTQVVPVPTVREADGLALSSRNRYLSAAERALAPLLHQVLGETARQLRHADAAPTLAAAIGRLREAGFAPDYLDLVDGPSLTPIASPNPGARLIAAARLGPVRLLDNIGLTQV